MKEAKSCAGCSARVAELEAGFKTLLLSYEGVVGRTRNPHRRKVLTESRALLEKIRVAKEAT